MKSAQDDRLLSANDVINLKFKIAPRVIKRVCKGIVFFFSFFFLQISGVRTGVRAYMDATPLLSKLSFNCF